MNRTQVNLNISLRQSSRLSKNFIRYWRISGLCLEMTHSVTRKFWMDEALNSAVLLENFYDIFRQWTWERIKEETFQVEKPYYHPKEMTLLIFTPKHVHYIHKLTQGSLDPIYFTYYVLSWDF